MSTHTTLTRWSRTGPDFLRRRYSRAHTWSFDGGLTVPASSSPHVVPPPWSDPGGIDPEEAFVASVSSCHMLWFLDVACSAGFVVEHYEDEAIGVMSENERGVLWISRITLRPRITWGGDRHPAPGEVEHLHHLAHDQCFIAASIRTEVVVEPRKEP
uniref:OsmC family protein n=1 Tax=uncultured Verrucomicrobiota bacterium TaxID=156588 RepID=D2DXV2_9BACT|nr:OsmC family protein [uncultured Verrucomicrobiota bacterium]